MAQNLWETENTTLLGRFSPGERVRILENPIGVRMEVPTGTILRADHWDGYYIVQLDSPAYYLGEDQEREILPDLRVAADNLVRISA
jgi:hypothetical protein